MSDTPRTDAEILDPEIVHQDSHSEGWVSIDFARQLERELNEAKRGAARYEVVRRMNATDFAHLLQRCLDQDLRFDDEVDRLAEVRTVRMHLRVKKEEA